MQKVFTSPNDDDVGNSDVSRRVDEMGLSGVVGLALGDV